VKETGISNLETGVPSGHLTVEAAAMRLGLDPFTVYSFIQRDRLSPILDAEGEYVVSEEEVNQLSQRKKE
jgi:predicted site-specific integrase-resolvase